MCGVLAWGCLRTLLVAHREASYETTPLLPDLRDRVHVHGRRVVAYGSHCRGDSALGDRRAAGANREVELSVAFECRKRVRTQRRPVLMAGPILG